MNTLQRRYQNEDMQDKRATLMFEVFKQKIKLKKAI